MSPRPFTVGVAIAISLLLAAAPAHAFRCGNKLVKRDMHEIEVRKVCGEPASVRNLGTTIRSVAVPSRGGSLPGATIERYGYYATEEVVVTEYVYNFGPRKFMRRLLFEGGILVRIEKIGYGYSE